MALHDLHTAGRGGVIHATATLSPTVFNEAVFGASYNKLNIAVADENAISRTALGIAIAQWNPSLNPHNYIPNMTFSSVPNFANPSLLNGIPYKNSNPLFTFVDNLSWIKGTHSLKTGVYVERTRKDDPSQVATRGSIAFDRNTTTARFSGQQQIDPTFLDYTAASNQRRLQFAIRMNW